MVGLAVAAVGLGTAELIAGLRRTWRSPVYDVGDRVIDRVPRPLKELAIDWFGTNDKVALLAGIGVALTLYSAAVGVAALRWRLAAGVVGVAVFGGLGAWAAVSARTDPPLDVAVPSLVGAVVAIMALTFIVRAATAAPSAVEPVEWLDPRDASSPEPHIDGDRDTDPAFDGAVELDPDAAGAAAVVDRRRALALSGGAAALAVAAFALGRRLATRFDVAAARAGTVLPRALRPLPPADPATSAPVEGVSPFFTPNEAFYRIDINLTVPRIAADTWRLRVHGLVEQPFELSYQQLVERELIERDITLTCVSNEVGGRLLGTARWLGVRLDDLLAEAGIQADADQIVGRSTDGYTCGFPVAALDGRDAMVAIAMNGAPLPLEHGYPARLIVPGLYGYVSATKWLAEIELSRFDRLDQYWVDRGWDREAPIKMSSRIDTPKGLETVPAGQVALAGVAWAQPVGVSAVQLRIDDADWVDATLADELSADTWRQWSFAWDATPGRHTITVRAIDANGAIQVEPRSEPFPSGSTGWHQIVVLVG